MRDYRGFTEQNGSAMYRVVYLVVIIVWAILIGSLLLTTDKPEEVQVELPAATQEAVEVSVESPVELPAESEEEPPLDLTKLRQIENATVTAYCICKKCCGKDPDHPAYGITASGRPAEPYVSVAVDPLLIPMGSTVYMDYGDGELLEFRADDTGGAVAGAHIDVCYPDHQSALEHGVRKARVYWKENVI